ncbi:sodium:proton antiporter [Clostridium sp. CM028]|uniref:Na+/H+ antiporter family protein n=1 Tax=unclassified Clostridium TaxID=2614128 RepID=UPI001C6F4D28|nr:MULTISPECIES: SLC13 family permease [unclassified Clostridium]MBW9144917.1 sodium:proton antiporter [Clostridium sp. CM027]MBW9148664.1 sodium:proton antiporter [Clostridium sp. CM028]UVE40058.1 sodium:proton antiporter [Clostridium sp. CM027]WLC60747.1 sodium:proton antiporter [Clostridium sp. CM028]
MLLFNPVVVSVIVMIILCLFKLNVLLSILIAAMTAGLVSGMSLGDTMRTLIRGMGGNAETALSYILLGALAVAVNKTGLAGILAKKISKIVGQKKYVFIMLLAFLGCFSQNLIPVHIAYIPILIPPLLLLMNKLKIDRRAVACALTFGLKAPYIVLPVGFGLIFHGIISSEMTKNGIPVMTADVAKVLWLPGIGMVIGLLIAVFYTYRKPREYKDIQIEGLDEIKDGDLKMNSKHWRVLIGAVSAFVIQVLTGSLPLGALGALIIIFVSGAVKFEDVNGLLDGGIKIMGLIAFIMLVASGYGDVLRKTGAVEALVTSLAGMVNGSKLAGAVLMLLVGLLVTMGIGSSFGTIPIVAAIYCPLAMKLGYSPLATILLIGVASALGDAGSPASDSTLGPTSGLSVDGQHDHIWDTCVPTFLHYTIPLMIFGIIGSMIF